MNKQASDANEIDLRPEYDFSGGMRGKYAATLREEGYTIREYNADGTYTETRGLGEKTVTLAPDVQGSRAAIATSRKGTRRMKFRIILEPSDEGGYTAYVPSLPGCISEGDNAEDALANIREAIELYLEPVEDDFVTEPGALVRELAL